MQQDFLEITARVVWCTVTTVDSAARPRSRILHPIFTLASGRPRGWVATGRTRVKVSHLRRNPWVAVSYWSPEQDTVLMQCKASWVEDVEEKHGVFELFATTPPPLGYQLDYGPAGADSPDFTPLRLDAVRVQVLRFQGWDKDVTGRHWHARDDGQIPSPSSRQV
jgi:general stress protein 26